ncbi:hypothetical protein [Stieleria varia]|uniref:Uncharacterized protein n=1 Tax=Stieleria varia TaxID=2528005 RepID=A0A5C6B6E3_9BACT|nr:hypothetical protein [Stieleria varia]TWU07520.1 hypothetical protein Pla52n_00930 [Stieleria varia]
MTNIRREADGWAVRIVRSGKEHSKYFRFSNGGVRKSLAIAKEWRDAKLSELGPRRWRSGPKKSRASNNSSGVTGVAKNKYGRWVAFWNEDGKQRFKTFRTKREAVEHRKSMAPET